jgi:hypothetical protein
MRTCVKAAPTDVAAQMNLGIALFNLKKVDEPKYIYAKR